MARKCSVCVHKQRKKIDKALLDDVTYSELTRRYGLSKDALRRHKNAHLTASLVKAKEVKEVAHGDDLLSRLQGLRDQAQRIANKAEKKNNFNAALSGIRELVRIVELLAKLKGDLKEGPTFNTLIVSTEWLTVQALVVQALEPYPEAKKAVMNALSGVCNARG
ncbi:MAG: hypothetical protein HQL54_13345 [Magnetococcales bacterium]|nr:hypothetical protein [Magnetococcales bacterium]